MTRARATLVAAALALAIGGCGASFHAAPLRGAPPDATFVDVDGVHVHYRERGTGPAVVLLHGFGASLESWSAVVPDVALHHRTIAIDLKGFGWTSRPPGDYSPAAQARLVWAVLDKLGVADVAIVGHSWGSSVALAMATQQPARTRRVAVYDAYVYDEQVGSFFRWAQRGAIGELLFSLYYRERIEDRAPLAYRDERWVTQPRVERVERDMDKPGTVAAALAAVRGHHFEELHRALRGFAKPVLVMWGADDQVTPLAFGHRLVEELANAELKVYPRCGHIPMVEAFRTSTRDLVKFLDADPPSQAEAEPQPEPQPEPKTTEPAHIPELGPPVEATLPPGADLATLGAELTPRAYAAARERTEVTVHGYLRARAAYLYNLDLDRGLDSRGLPIFPVPLDGSQAVDSADLRARTDVAIYARGLGVAVKGRIDWVDNAALGGSADLTAGAPALSTGQRPTYAVVKRAWAEALTPAGTLAVGRMGAHFGLGIAANGGDCEDCDHGDSADRIAFVSPIGGHLVALAYDVAARGPFTQSPDGGHAIGLLPSDQVGGPTLAILKVHSPAALARRAAAGLVNTEYAVYASHRMQDKDVPASYLAVPAPTTFTSNSVVSRGFEALAAGAWLRITTAHARVEAELAYISASLAQPSLVPGAAITEPVTSSQLGFALQTELAIGSARIGFDGGYASGDAAPGFDAFPRPGETPPPPGAFDGPHANPPTHNTVDNFRFHPDFHIDQILFREIIGTVTDAIYVRPHARARLADFGAGRLELGAALIASWAVEPIQTPGNARSLGVELDPELRYATHDFAATIDYAVLFPGAAFDNPTANLKAQPAQLLRARLVFFF